MALLVNRKLLNFRWVDADLVLSLAALPALARIKSIAGLTSPTNSGLNNQSVCKVVAGKLSGTLKKLVQGEEYQLEAVNYSGWSLAGAVRVADLVVTSSKPTPTPTPTPAPVITLVSLALTGPANVPEGASGTYSVVGTYSNAAVGLLTTGLIWSENAPGGVLSIPADSVVGNGRSVTIAVTAGEGLVATRVVQVLDATTASQPAPAPDPAGRRQTVGIFDVATNTLVAMPVVDEPYSDAPIKWDGKNIRGVATDPNRTYEARPVSNAADLTVATTWKGVMANNSDSFTGASVWGSNRPSCMVFRGGKGRYGASYIERGQGHCHFDVTRPGARVLNPHYLSESQSVDAVCADAERTYHAGVSFATLFNPATGQSNTGYFITATTNSDESEYVFTSGETFRSETQTYSACDLTGESFTALGIAVQQQGRLLLSVHPDRVVFFDKRAGGAPLGSVALAGVTAIAFQNDTTLALCHGTTVALYALGATSLTLTSIRPVPVPAGFTPRSIAFSPVNPQLSVLCGQPANTPLTSTAKHRIFHFDTRNYDAPPRLDGTGDLGLDPRVSDDTFCFTGHPYLAYDEQGNYWFMDDEHRREQQRAPTGTLLYTRYCAGTTYNPTINATDPSRVFNEYLEYGLDHTKEKLPANTNGWWWLKYNRICFKNDEYTGVTEVITTAANGRTLSLARFGYRWIVCEWTAAGITYWPQVNIDLTGTMDRNGDLLEAEGFYAGNVKRLYRSAFTGNASGVPVYAARVLEGSAPQVADSPNATGMFCGPTTDGTYGCYALGGEGFHLGGIRRGHDRFVFEAAPSTWINYQGPFPSKGEYDIGNGVWYPGSFLLSIDNYFIWAFRGERWKNGQTTKFMMTTSQGVYVGQFGTVRDGAFMSLLEPAAPGQGGNAIKAQVVKVGTTYVLLHGDENNHGGFQIWEFDLSSVVHHPAYAITATAPVPLPGVSLMGPIPFDNLGFGSGSTIGNWKTSGNCRAETSRDSRTSIRFMLGGGGRAYAPFPVSAGELPGYRVTGYFVWGMGGLNSFYYPIAGLEFKDTSGKTYARLRHDDDGQGHTINSVNGVTITTGVALVAAIETSELRPFYLRVSPAGELFFSYNGRPEVAVPLFSGIDPATHQPYPAGNPLRPGTVEINFTAYGNATLGFSVDQLRLLPA